MHLAREVKSNNKGFKYISSRRKTRKNVGPVLNGAGDLVPCYRQKAEVLDAFFGSVFASSASLQ